MPPVVKRRGRSKGHTLTVCGLPSRKRRKGAKSASFALSIIQRKKSIINKNKY